MAGMRAYRSGGNEILCLPCNAHRPAQDKERVGWLEAATAEVSDKLEICAPHAHATLAVNPTKALTEKMNF